MKKLIVLSLLAAACAAHKPLPQVPPFEKTKVCSDESLAYMVKPKPVKTGTPKFHTEAEIQNRMINLEPMVRKCYENLLQAPELSDAPVAFNLCLVFGYNVKGQQEFFQFSTREYNMPESMKACLDSIKQSKELEGLKSVSVLQPFRLYPVQ